MNRKERAFSPPAAGGSSLIVIFAVLCLTVFAMLSLSTVRANARVSEAAATAVTGYYEADCEAERILALLRCAVTPENVSESGGVYSYDCPISDTQTLKVEVKVSGGEYEILRWQAVRSAGWQADEYIEVWSGEKIN